MVDRQNRKTIEFLNDKPYPADFDGQWLTVKLTVD